MAATRDPAFKDLSGGRQRASDQPVDTWPDFRSGISLAIKSPSSRSCGRSGKLKTSAGSIRPLTS
jgi:hypothetical protein